MALLAICIVASLPVFTLIAVFFVPEPKEYSCQRVSFRSGLGHMLGNRPFVRFASAFLLNGLANGIAASLFLLYCSERLELSELRGPSLLTYFLAGIVGIPFWNWLSRRSSRHHAWCVAMVFAILVFSPAPFLPVGSTLGFGVICFLSGLAVGADLALPPAIQADVIDVDTAISGEQRSGTYFAVWSLVTKLALALAVGLAFPLLGYFGFDPSPGATSTASGIALLGFVYGWGPILFKLPAILLMRDFPLDRETVARNRATIEANSSS